MIIECNKVLLNCDLILSLITFLVYWGLTRCCPFDKISLSSYWVPLCWCWRVFSQNLFLRFKALRSCRGREWLNDKIKVSFQKFRTFPFPLKKRKTPRFVPLHTSVSFASRTVLTIRNHPKL